MACKRVNPSEDISICSKHPEYKLRVRSPEEGDGITSKLPRRAGSEHVGECDERRRKRPVLAFSVCRTGNCCLSTYARLGLFFCLFGVGCICKRKSKSPEPAFVVVVVAAAAAANQCFLGPTTTPTHLVRCGLRKSGYCPFSIKKARSKGRSRLRAAI